jgi:hypothetical protein
MTDSPQVSLSPNPVADGTTLSIRADRSVTFEIFTMLGTRLGQPQLIPGNQQVEFLVQGIAAGLYVARFTSESGSSAIRFVVY